LYTLLY